MRKSLFKSISIFLCCLLLITAFTGCNANKSADNNAANQKSSSSTENNASKETSGQSEAEPKKEYVIALHNYSEQFESSVLIANGVREAAKKYGVKLVEADIANDTNKIQPNIDNFILQGVDAIIDATWYADIGAQTVNKCKEKGIPVISCDVIFSETDAWMVGADNYESGKIIGKYMADVVKEKWNGLVDYLVITWPQTAGEAVQDRMQGGIDGLREGGIDIPDDRVVWFDSEGQTLKAKNIAQDFLTAHPDAKHILFAGNNDTSGLGILSGVQTAGREDDCMIYSYGGEPSAIENFKKEDNCWIATISFNLEGYGEIAIPSAIDILEGKDVPRQQSPELFVIDREYLKNNPQ